MKKTGKINYRVVFIATNIVLALMVAEISIGSSPTIAVFPFTNPDGTYSNIGNYVSMVLSKQFMESGAYTPIARETILYKLIKEHSLQLSGVIDINTMKKMGKILAADYILTGVILPFFETEQDTTSLNYTTSLNFVDRKIGVMYKIVNVETGKIESIEIKIIPVTPALMKAVKMDRELLEARHQWKLRQQKAGNRPPAFWEAMVNRYLNNSYERTFRK